MTSGSPICPAHRPASEQSRRKLLDRYCMPLSNGQTGLQIIPVLDELDAEVLPERIAIDRIRIPPIADAAVGRLKKVSSRLLAENNAGWLSQVGFQTVWLILPGNLRNKILTKIRYAPGRENLLR